VIVRVWVSVFVPCFLKNAREYKIARSLFLDDIRSTPTSTKERAELKGKMVWLS
jgi:hypothetical protein